MRFTMFSGPWERKGARFILLLSCPHAENHAFYDVFRALGAENHAFYDTLRCPQPENHAFYDVFRPRAAKLHAFLAFCGVHSGPARLLCALLQNRTISLMSCLMVGMSNSCVSKCSIDECEEEHCNHRELDCGPPGSLRENLWKHQECDCATASAHCRQGVVDNGKDGHHDG